MSTGPKMPLVEAIAKAEAFRDEFAGCFDEWHVCGSVRRCKAMVGDIDHVVVAKDGPVVPAGGMFPETVNLMRERFDAMLAAGSIEKALYGDARVTRWGDRKRGALFQGVRHEVWLVHPDQLGPALAIATGPDEFSRELVTALRTRGVYQQGAPGKEGFVVDQRTGAIRPCPSERDYLALCGMVWVDPTRRG